MSGGGDTNDGDGSGGRPTRRQLLLGLAAVVSALVAAVMGFVGLGFLGDDNDDPPPEDTDSEAYRDLVERFAPDLYFGAGEKWFPTDPRDYETDGAVSGFVALNDYTRDFKSSGSPPSPTVFYNVVERRGLVVVQYWMYSVFDQFSVNFHWHDWELLQVFVDSETEEAVLLSASAHSRKVPNNEYLEPGFSGSERPGVRAEVGSHSSATEVNARESFQRSGGEDFESDVTGTRVSFGDGDGVPIAYGLPRDEGFGLAFAAPELDGEPIQNHELLPDVEADDLVPSELTVDDIQELVSPPSDLPRRRSGELFVHSGSGSIGDYTYELRDMSEVMGAVEDFVGPQLSFEFAIPGFVEDRFSSYITSVGIPWEQDRFREPESDVTDGMHLDYLRDEYGLAVEDTGNVLVGVVGAVTSGAGGAIGRYGDSVKDALGSYVSVSLASAAVEATGFLESEPDVIPSSGGRFAAVGVEPGRHRFTVNAAGYAPYSEEFVYRGGTHRTGVDGDVWLVERGDAVKVRGDASETGLSNLRVVEDFAGTVYDGSPPSERFAVYVHREGNYSVEVTDEEGVVGAFRVRPGEDDVVTVDVGTGKASLAGYVGELLGDAADLVGEFGDDGSLAVQDDTDQTQGGMQTDQNTTRDDADADATDTASGRLVTYDDLESRLRSGSRSAFRASALAGTDGEAADEELRITREETRGAADLLGEGGFPETVETVLTEWIEEALERTEEALSY